MSFIKKWLGIKTPKKLSQKDIKSMQPKAQRMSMTPQTEKLTAGFMKDYWDDEKQNRTKLTSRGPRTGLGGGNLFS